MKYKKWSLAKGLEISCFMAVKTNKMKFKNILNLLNIGLLFLILQLSTSIFAQKNVECGTVINEGWSSTFSQALTESMKSGNPSVVIPVVIHVLFNNSAYNISNTEANQIMDQLNLDFAKMNVDTIMIPSVWDTIATNTNIQFCLAKRDPTGAPSTGIERRNTYVTQFNDYSSMKFNSFGGLDVWDPANYFNIWICNFSGPGGTHAFAISPSSTISNVYGVVIDRGSVGTGLTTLTHELGHCFNLSHIWGNYASSSCVSDFVNDTPEQEYSSGGCFTFPFVDNCSPDSNGRMFMNFMDYGDCRSIFTQGQANRMHVVLSNSPYDQLTLSNGCVPVNLELNDVGAFSILSPTNEVCNTDTLYPIVVIRNWGTNSLQSSIISYQVGSSPLQTYSWSGNLLSLEFDTIQLPSIISSSGSQVFSVSTSMPNGVLDQNNSNDLTSSNTLITLNGNNLPLFYGFEDTLTPPIDWSLTTYLYPNIAKRSTAAFKSGSAALEVDMTYIQNEVVRLTTPNLDLTSTSVPELNFELAYRMRYDTLNYYIDSLEVLISEDCGLSWQSIYQKYAYDLATVSAIVLSDFIPNSIDWRLETIDLSQYMSSSNVMFQFKFSSSWGGIIWLDDINISGGSPLSVEDNSNNSSFSIYPNPNKGQFKVHMPSLHSESMKIEIYNSKGQIVFTEDKIDLNEKKINISLHGYPKGLYFLKITDYGFDKLAFFSTTILYL